MTTGIEPEERLLALAVEVLERADRDHPADRVLREVLHRESSLSQAGATRVSRWVFQFYRWKGWLKDERGLVRKIRKAEELAERFEKNPFSLRAETLRAKAVPSWVHEVMDVSDAWLRSLQREPRLFIRARPGQGRALMDSLGHLRKTYLPDAYIYEGKKDLFRTPDFAHGRFEIQDIASQIVGHLCAPQPGENWWDACAGEGGKTLHLADLMQNRGQVWATDTAEWRLERLRRRAARAKVFNYQASVWDGGPQRPMTILFDGVLVDAPCTGIGTWQRNPHARWTTRPEDVQELSALQKRLLEHVAPAVKPGGRLVYAVCTMTRAETTEVVAAFQASHPEFEPLPLRWPLPGLPDWHTPTLMLWPQDTGGNGMFIAAWRRRKTDEPTAPGSGSAQFDRNKSSEPGEALSSQTLLGPAERISTELPEK
jgi:16S rRNA (cytosine967-C5)-methyltransferase